MKNRLRKTGKKKSNSFLKRSLVISLAICGVSIGTFIPLIQSTQSTNEELITQIEDYNKETDLIEKNNQDLANPIELK